MGFQELFCSWNEDSVWCNFAWRADLAEEEGSSSSERVRFGRSSIL